MKTKIKTSNIFKKRILTILVCCLLVPSLVVNGQDVKHSLAGITTTMNHYSYIHRINDSTGIEVKYFIVEAPNGTIKTCFDACDICYQYHLGYIQLGTFTRCVYCGNTYPTNDVGTSLGSGVCWPAYLPHTLEPDSLVLTVTDLTTKLYYFEEVWMPSLTGIKEENSMDFPASFNVIHQLNQMTLNMTTKEQRMIYITGINGQVFYSRHTSVDKLSIHTENLSSGIYLLLIMEGDKLYAKKFVSH